MSLQPYPRVRVRPRQPSRERWRHWRCGWPGHLGRPPLAASTPPLSSSSLKVVPLLSFLYPKIVSYLPQLLVLLRFGFSFVWGFGAVAPLWLSPAPSAVRIGTPSSLRILVFLLLPLLLLRCGGGFGFAPIGSEIRPALA